MSVHAPSIFLDSTGPHRKTRKILENPESEIAAVIPGGKTGYGSIKHLAEYFQNEAKLGILGQGRKSQSITSSFLFFSLFFALNAMSSNLETAFREALYSFDTQKILDFFRDMPEDDRRTLVPLIAELGKDSYHSPAMIPVEAIPELQNLVDRTPHGRPTYIDMRKHREAFKMLEPKVEAFKLGTPRNRSSAKT